MRNSKYEFHTYINGGFFNKEYKKIHKIEEGNYWFSNKQEREDFLIHLKDLEITHKFNHLCYNLNEGYYTRFDTVVSMKLNYNNQKYKFEYNFGVGYPKNAAYYMFHNGNYSCDCNLSLFLRSIGVNILELECGNEIEISNFKTFKRRINERRRK